MAKGQLNARRFPVSDHCAGARFFNPHAVTGRTIADLIKWQRTRQAVPWPAAVSLTPHPMPPGTVGPREVAVTFIGHATFLLRTAAAVVLTDPVFTSHAGPFGRFGPPRVRLPGIPFERLPPADVVLVSHNHYDHLQPTSLRACQDRGAPVFIAPLGLGENLRTLGLQNVVELDWWETASARDARITCMPAQHFSARTPFDRNRTLWCGFVIESGDARIYFAGDSGYSPQFAEIGRRVRDIDVALIPIGAYEPRWFMQPMHMNPAEAVRAHLDVGTRVSIGMHFGTFRLTDEGIDDPLRALERARDELHVAPDAFRVLDFGETVTL
jgi:L-ascorbate metabolism protein UlaG (beta-lactamase superfamily)